MAKIVFPLHGIRTRAEWQKAFADVAAKHSWKCPLDRWHYGVFSIFNFVNPKDRFAKVTWFRKRYSEAQNEYQTIIDNFEKRPSVVAHSFGTYILGYSLLRYNNIKFDKVILCGSILPKNFPWDELIESGQVRAVRNDIGVEDYWSKVCGYVIPGTGSSGNQGFSKKHPRLIETEHNLMHSEFFESEWMETNWLPFLDTKFESPTNPRTERIKIPSGDHPLTVFLVWSVLLVAFITSGVIAFTRAKHFFSPQKVELEISFHEDPPEEIPGFVRFSQHLKSKSSLIDLTVKRGHATIELPWNAKSIDSISFNDDRYTLESKGPFKLSGSPLKLNASGTYVRPYGPHVFPDLVTLANVPTRKELEKLVYSKMPAEVILYYRNKTTKNIILLAFDVSVYYANPHAKPKWEVWRCPREYEPFNAFEESSKGAFYFVARDLDTEQNFPLGWFGLFEHEKNYLDIIMDGPNVTATLSTAPGKQ